MPYKPTEIWERLSPEFKQQIINELSLTFQEIINEYLRTNHSYTPGPQSHYLHSAVESPSSADQQGEPAFAIKERALNLGWQTELPPLSISVLA